MVKKQTLIIFLLFTAFILFFSVHIDPAEAAGAKQHVYDNAGLLNKQEISKLEALAKVHGEKQQTDFIILTTNSTDGKSIETYMGDFYDKKGFGYNKKYGNTVLFTIDMGQRKVYLAGFGKAEKYLDDERVNLVLDRIMPFISDGDYYGAFQKTIELSSKYMEYRPGVNPESILLKWWFQLVIALVIGGTAVGIMAYNSGGRVTINEGTYFDQHNSRVNSSRDVFVNQTVTRTRKPSDDNRSGGGGSGGGGVTGGGHSYSGGGRSF